MKLSHLFEDIDLTLQKDDVHYKKLIKTIKFLEKRKKILILTTSNRGGWAEKELKEEPKSTKLAKAIQDFIGKNKVTLIEVPDLKIYTCEANVSHMDGNQCGLKKASLDDKEKNPTGHHRCWRNINNPDDELWKISKSLFESDTVLFFGSIRWGQMNAVYQNLIERLTWLENRHSTLGESNLLKDISCGIIAIGQNWNGENVVDTQKKVLSFFGFDVKDELSWNWQFTKNPNDESKESYKQSGKDFLKTFEL
jgi:multimeric flavodoxin WrbA